jgi:chaperonin cofactor prefoldin
MKKKTKGSYWVLLYEFETNTGKTELEKEGDSLNVKIQEYAKQLEAVQTQQAEDSRGISRQQKNAERYIAKKQMLASRKDECSKSIRDLGVLPEEAYGKYTKVKLDRVSVRASNGPARRFFVPDAYMLRSSLSNNSMSSTSRSKSSGTSTRRHSNSTTTSPSSGTSCGSDVKISQHPPSL